MERSEDVLKARARVRGQGERHAQGWKCWGDAAEYQRGSRTLSNVVLRFEFHSGTLNASGPRFFFMALSIYDLGNLKNTCLEAEPKVIILAYPYHKIPVDKSRNIWIHEWMLAKFTRKKKSLQEILEGSSQNK